MRELEPPFEIEYQGGISKVTEAEIRSRRIFHILFPDTKKPLIITVANGPREKRFWTSIPEGRQQEAEEVGRLIASYIRNKRI